MAVVDPAPRQSRCTNIYSKALVVFTLCLSPRRQPLTFAPGLPWVLFQHLAAALLRRSADGGRRMAITGHAMETLKDRGRRRKKNSRGRRGFSLARSVPFGVMRFDDVGSHERLGQGGLQEVMEKINKPTPFRT